MSPVQPIAIQRRLMELGRVRLGEKGKKGEPRKLSSFRFTSASGTLLAAVADRYGGTPREWEGAPNEGMYEVTTEATELDIILPPTFSEADGSPSTSYSQWFELWTAGGVQRRCDGVTEAITGNPCMCDPEQRECDITTRVSFMLPDVPGLGVWRLDSKGYNAAVELPGTLEVLVMAAAEQKFIPAVLRIENRVKKVEGQTRRYVVPVIDLPNVTIGQLVSGDVPTALNAPQPAPPKPALPAGPAQPGDSAFEAAPAWGPAPEIEERRSGETTAAAGPEDPSALTPPAGSPHRLTQQAFRHQCAAALIAPPDIAASGRRLYPGLSMAALTDDERGVLFAELMREKTAQGTLA